jgi:hypothetical protein
MGYPVTFLWTKFDLERHEILHQQILQLMYQASHRGESESIISKGLYNLHSISLQHNITDTQEACSFDALRQSAPCAWHYRQIAYTLHPTEAVFSYFKIPKILQDFPSHQIFGRMHGTLNVDKK